MYPQRFDGEEVELRGRITEADGRPVERALVQAITPSNPHNWHRVIAEARTNADGTFRLEPIPSDALSAIVVRTEHGPLTFDRRLMDGERGPVDLGAFTTGPMRDVPFLVRCTGAVTPFESREAEMQISVLQEESGELIVWDHLTFESSEPHLEGVLPGRARYFRGFPLDAREVRGVFRLPVGTHTVTLVGSCGSALSEVVVAPRGPVGFEAALPVPGHDAEMVLEAAAGMPCPMNLHVSVASERGGRSTSHTLRLQCGEQLRLGPLPPSAASVSLESQRCDDIGLRSAHTTRVTLRADGTCDESISDRATSGASR